MAGLCSHVIQSRPPTTWRYSEAAARMWTRRHECFHHDSRRHLLAADWLGGQDSGAGKPQGKCPAVCLVGRRFVRYFHVIETSAALPGLWATLLGPLSASFPSPLTPREGTCAGAGSGIRVRAAAQYRPEARRGPDLHLRPPPSRSRQTRRGREAVTGPHDDGYAQPGNRCLVEKRVAAQTPAAASSAAAHGALGPRRRAAGSRGVLGICEAHLR